MPIPAIYSNRRCLADVTLLYRRGITDGRVYGATPARLFVLPALFFPDPTTTTADFLFFPNARIYNADIRFEHLIASQ